MCCMLLVQQQGCSQSLSQSMVSCGACFKVMCRLACRLVCAAMPLQWSCGATLRAMLMQQLLCCRKPLTLMWAWTDLMHCPGTLHWHHIRLVHGPRAISAVEQDNGSWRWGPHHHPHCQKEASCKWQGECGYQHPRLHAYGQPGPSHRVPGQASQTHAIACQITVCRCQHSCRCAEPPCAGLMRGSHTCKVQFVIDDTASKDCRVETAGGLSGKLHVPRCLM